MEADYKALESELREKIENIETDYPDYDEYQYHLDEIGHNPFESPSYLTAKLHAYTRAEAQAEIQALFEKQYTLTLREEVQTRYRTETTTDPETGETTTEEVPYDYYILHVTLTNKNISTLPGSFLPHSKRKCLIFTWKPKAISRTCSEKISMPGHRAAGSIPIMRYRRTLYLMNALPP